MLQLIGRILRWFRGGTLNLLILAGIILLIWGFFAPVGTLVWWLDQGAEIIGLRKNRLKELPAGNGSNAGAKPAKVNCYIIFLPGVGDFSADELTPGEETFLNRLVQKHPNCVAVSDVFPYSASNQSLGGQRLFAPVWRFANNAKGWRTIGDILVKIRNLWRFAISVDPRYGPVYNQGIATAIIERMRAKQSLSVSSEQPLNIVLIGTSGGVQVALGAAPYLNQWLNAQISVVSIGGVFNGSNGFEAADQVYHLQGRQDWIDDLGSIVFASRWYGNVGSPFNQARLAGHYKTYIIGSHAHDGEKGYFGEASIPENSGTYVDVTIEEVNKLPIWNLKNSPSNSK